MAYRNKSPSFQAKFEKFFHDYWEPLFAAVSGVVLIAGLCITCVISPKTLMTFDYRGVKIYFKQEMNGDLYYYHSESGKKFDSKDDLRAFIDGVLVDEEGETYDTETVD